MHIFKNKKDFSSQRGFSLMEVLVVIAIIGVLAGVVMVALANARDKGKAGRVQADLHQLQTAAAELEADTHKFPGGCPTDGSATDEVSLDSPNSGMHLEPAVGVVSAPCEWTDQDVANWKGSYSDHSIDAWSRSYRFHPAYLTHCDAGTPVYQPVIYSLGEDGTMQFPFDTSCNPQTTDDMYQILNS